MYIYILGYAVLEHFQVVQPNTCQLERRKGNCRDIEAAATTTTATTTTAAEHKSRTLLCQRHVSIRYILVRPTEACCALSLLLSLLSDN